MRKFNPCKESKQQEIHVDQFQPQFERTSKTNQTTKVLVISLRTRCLRNQINTIESIQSIENQVDSKKTQVNPKRFKQSKENQIKFKLLENPKANFTSCFLLKQFCREQSNKLSKELSKALSKFLNYIKLVKVTIICRKFFVALR